MMRVKLIHGLLGFVLLFGSLIGLMADDPAFAAQENRSGSFMLLPEQGEPPPKAELKLESQFPVLRGKSGERFDFDVALTFTGSATREFELSATAPPQWITRTLRGSGDGEIGAIVLDPTKGYPERIKIVLAPLAFYYPEEGEYIVTLEVASGNVKESIQLKVVVTARYELSMVSATGRLNTEANAGEENTFTVQLINTGSTAIENVTFASNKPEGWNVKFDPDKVDSIDAGTIQDVNVIIEPPRRTIAGDYVVTLRANSKDVSDRLELRVTVLTPSIWGWVGILIVLIVIAGLGVIFWRLGRR